MGIRAGLENAERANWSAEKRENGQLITSLQRLSEDGPTRPRVGAMATQRLVSIAGPGAEKGGSKEEDLEFEYMNTMGGVCVCLCLWKRSNGQKRGS